MKIGKARETSSIITLSLLTISGAHLVSHVFGSVHTALFPVFREEFHLSLQQLGLIAAIPPLVQVLSYIPSGLISDRFGQKTLIVISFLVAGVSAFGMSASSNVLMLIFFLSILSTAITIYHPPAYSLTSELFPREIRGRALGIHGAGGTLGMALGPLSLSLFLGYLFWNWRRIYLFWAFPILLYIPIIIRLRTQKQGSEKISEHKDEDEKTPQEGVRSIISMGFVGFILFQAVRGMGRQIVGTFVPTYMHDQIGLTVAEAGFIYGAASLTGVVAAPAGGYLSDRLGDKRWLIIAIGSWTIFLLLASLTSSGFIFSILYWCSGFFSSSSMGASSSIIARYSPSGRRGLGYALYFLPNSIVSTISPIIGAYIASAYGLWSIFPVSVSVVALSLAILKYGVSDS